MDTLHQNLMIILSLLFAVFILSMLSQKLRVSYPILLVIGGLLISLIPQAPHIAIDPELIFLIFLPPLLYEAAWNTSWSNFWKRKRQISLLAFGLVVFTSLVLAHVSVMLIPGFTLALGFLLGGIVSPTDAVSATSILKGGLTPKRVQTILEGESLINDAAGLIIFRFALAAVVSGHFYFIVAATDFFLVAGMGIVTGVAIAYLNYLIHVLLPTNPSLHTALSLMFPYIMYVAAESFGFSGVMSVVSGGLFLSLRSHRFLKYDSRIQATGVWSTITFLLNGLVFILIGLQLPIVIENLNEKDALAAGIYYGILISILVFIIRLVWVFPAIFVPRILSKKIRETENNPGWRAAFLISWAGMRGVVSLAAALSLPLTLADGSAFPQRNTILLITFIVILFTLLLQGLSLPYVIKKLKIVEMDEKLSKDEQATTIRLRMTEASLTYLNNKYPEEIINHEIFQNLKAYYENISSIMNKKLENMDGDSDEKEVILKYNRVLLELISVQRQELIAMRSDIQLDHNLLLNQENRLDLEEARIDHKETIH